MNRQHAAEKALQDQTNILPFAQLMVVFIGLATSLTITFVEQNGICLTLPVIARDLSAKDTISWAGTSSLIANTIFMVLYGRLSDIFGRKVVYLSALSLLSIATLLCGLAQNPTMFYVARGLAGVAGGGITTLTTIMVSDIVAIEQQGRYQGILGASVGVGNILGPFIAAAFVIRSTWRGFFWVISPLAALTAILGYFLMPGHVQKAPRPFLKDLYYIDWLGIGVSAIGIIFTLIPISGGGSYFQWESPMVISMFVVGGCAFILFILIEWKFALLPILPVEFFRNKTITVLFLQSFFLGAVSQVNLYYLTLYYQNARGWSPIISASLTSCMMVFQSLFSVLAGHYISWTKRYGEVLWVGFGLWTLGAGLMLIFDNKTHPGIIAVCLSISGAGFGCTFQPTILALQAHATKAQRAVAISNRNFFRCMGGAFGLAISAAILQATLRAELPSGFHYLAESSYAIPAQSSLHTPHIMFAYAKASHAVFLFQVPLVGVCFLSCLLIRDHGLERLDEVEKDSEKAVHEPSEKTN